jgi:hypothetical protein
MAIPESQLNILSKQGSITQSSSTYETIKGLLESSDAPYAGKNFVSFLQGSYGNDTNIYADSDVDIVMRIDSVYHDDLSGLTEDDKSLYNSYWSAATYTFNDFKRDVVAHLIKKFGASGSSRATRPSSSQAAATAGMLTLSSALNSGNTQNSAALTIIATSRASRFGPVTGNR